jgi:hypothetical protein
MKFLLVSLLSVVVLGCASSKPATRTAEVPAAKLNDGYQVQFTVPETYQQDDFQGHPLHRFAAVDGGVTYTFTLTNIPGLTASFVGGSIKEMAKMNGFELVSFEDITIEKAQAAQSFVGKREKFTINGIAVGSNDRLFHLITEFDAADPAQVAASKAFLSSLKL